MGKNYTTSGSGTTQPIDLDSTIGFQASLLSSKLRKSLLDILNHDTIKVNPDELGILTLLAKADSITMSDLAKNMMKDNANMTRLVKNLRQYGFVDQKKDRFDRRKSCVFLTLQGKEEMSRAWSLMDQMISHALHNISEADHDIARGVLKKINENLSEFMKENN